MGVIWKKMKEYKSASNPIITISLLTYRIGEAVIVINVNYDMIYLVCTA